MNWVNLKTCLLTETKIRRNIFLKGSDPAEIIANRLLSSCKAYKYDRGSQIVMERMLTVVSVYPM